MKRESIAVVEEPDRAVILDLEGPTATPLLLEGSAFDIWNEIDGDSDTADIVLQLSRRLGIDPDQIQADVESFLLGLEMEHLISRTGQLAKSIERSTS